ncbi:DnaB-like helicase N-terminal domain-containing protein, partial [Bacillus altitudinis]|uniref:DnaB-like helicase N-terminal domain-containing protein n=1 Tax=Bacillus altitudinis TaxID=293387 RepID=UPI003B527441
MSHQNIYNPILLLPHTAQPLHLLTLTSQLPNTHLLQHLPGISYLTHIPNSLPTPPNIQYYPKILQQKSILRPLIPTP